MELLQLKYFIHVAKLEHISRAAEDLNISQPALSLTIRRLENELGVALFEREGRNIKLTEYGKAFLKKVEPAFYQIQESVNELKELDRLDKKRLVLASPPLYAFPGLIQQINRECPDLILRNIYTTVNDAKEMMRSKQVDFSIIIAPSDKEPETEFSVLPLRSDSMVVVLSTQHRFSNCETIHLDQLIEENFSCYPTGMGSRPILDDYFGKRNVTPHIAYEANSAREILDSITTNSYVSLMQYSMVEKYIGTEVVAIPLDDPLNVTLQLYSLKNAKPRPLAIQFQEVVLRYFEKEKIAPAASYPGYPGE